ncbi:hypothetical protein SD81_021845 [Tolypothrix campylonemoides VB511288]|nr:hypothetical protein SD81_021845 [Tolypothrix campylonemoides VB511288]
MLVGEGFGVRFALNDVELTLSRGSSSQAGEDKISLPPSLTPSLPPSFPHSLTPRSPSCWSLPRFRI